MTPDSLTKDFILSEVKKLQYLYGLKREIRYGQSRPEGDLTESVAEHIYALHVLAQYFLPLEDPEGKMNKLKILQMITIHDFDEIETGDTITYLKTPDMYAQERVARLRVLEKIPQHMQTNLTELSEEYEDRKTQESLFVKALDAFEPLIQIYSPFGLEIMKINQPTPENNQSSKDPHIVHFPVMWEYYQVIHQAMIDEGFFDHA
jgi:5'-deoxynucleotidase YfbR-like HD superfamily hydrolase